MRRMSFALTTAQYLDHSKTVTRRMGWRFLVGCAPRQHRLMGIVKGMGLKKGERQVELGASDVLSARLEPVSAITPEDVVREGFPGWTVEQFVEFFCKANGCTPETVITRIEFRQDFPRRAG